MVEYSEEFQEARRMAEKVVRGSIVEKATIQFITQIVEEITLSQIKPLQAQVHRLKHVEDTIRVNAIKGMGCTDEEADAYVNGTAEKTFIEAMSDHVQKQST